MNIIRTTLLFGLVSLMLLNCKKGENDPSLSLVSRKSRISNEWNIKEWTLNYKSENYKPNAINPSSTLQQELKDNLFLRKTTGIWGDNTEEGTVNTSVWTIYKDYKWSKTISFTSVLNNVTTTRTIKTNGTWYFLGKIDEFKNKERIVFNTLESGESTTESYSNGSTNNYKVVASYSDNEESVIFEINQLKNKETILIREQSYRNISQAQDNLTTNNEYFLLTEK